MTQSFNALSAYQAASNMTTSLGAVVMLYDGMIKEVGKAKSAIEEGRIEDRFNATQKACQILLGLQSHLDFERGGDISLMKHRRRLRSLSRFDRWGLPPGQKKRSFSSAGLRVVRS